MERAGRQTWHMQEYSNSASSPYGTRESVSVTASKARGRGHDVVRSKRNRLSVKREKQAKGKYGCSSDYLTHRRTQPAICSTTFSAMSGALRAAACTLWERKAGSQYLLSNDVGIVGGFDLEGAIIRPEINGICHACDASLIYLSKSAQARSGMFFPASPSRQPRCQLLKIPNRHISSSIRKEVGIWQENGHRYLESHRLLEGWSSD